MNIEAPRPARRTYPYLPAANWWALRRQFQRTIPRGEVDAAYLAGILNITEPAARNLVGPLRAIGLIGDDNRTTDRALAWREDDQYRQVTTEILEQVYPQGLRDVAPPPDPDRGTVERWFSRATGAGQVSADRMARFYLLLAAGDPVAAEQPAERSPRTTQAAPRESRQTRETRRITDGRRAVDAPAPAQQQTPPVVTSRQPQPSLHIDVQVHIDPAATAEQIDQIFASMARHLYDRS